MENESEAASPMNVNVEVAGSELGCYFCSDVTAPGDSMIDRTLDQQCTISRSGLSMIASGMAVELLASTIQHPLLGGAPAKLMGLNENSSMLGGTPHQIRGFLSHFNMMTPTVKRFPKCTACGEQVQNLYKNNGFKFLEEVFQNAKVLEQVTGLTELQDSLNDVDLNMLEYDEVESV